MSTKPAVFIGDDVLIEAGVYSIRSQRRAGNRLKWRCAALVLSPANAGQRDSFLAQQLHRINAQSAMRWN